MDYRANIDAVTWFARESCRALWPSAPTRRSRSSVRGRHRCRACAQRERRSPVGSTSGAYCERRRRRTAADWRGVQNKVLEAMAKPIVATPLALQGLGPAAGRPGGASERRQALGQALATRRARVPAARERVIDRFGWGASLAQLRALVLGEPVPVAQAS
jgi:hypothetical protein